MKLSSKHLRNSVAGLLLSCVLFSAVGCTSDNKSSDEISEEDISDGILRKEVFALVSSAENSDTDYSLQYGYIEDIGDGRGYTAGIIGFTTGTGDLPDVVERYTGLSPVNGLKKYIPALKKGIGTDSHEGLGDDFVSDWEAAALTDEMINAQNDILDHQYMSPAIMNFIKECGLYAQRYNSSKCPDENVDIEKLAYTEDNLYDIICDKIGRLQKENPQPIPYRANDRIKR